MTQVKSGDTVKVHYTGKFEDGSVFDTTTDRDPYQFKIGAGRVIPGFEQALVGMQPGESKTVRIPANEAYGPYHQEMVGTVERTRLPGDVNPQVGQQLEVKATEGQSFVATITDVSDQAITLDANHPLAGKDLIFDISLIDIA